MPLCISCRGEYWVPTKESKETETQRPEVTRQPWEDPTTESPSPAETEKPPLAQVYGLADLPPYICARCGQSNERWHQWVDRGEGAHFGRFFGSFWGLQALISVALPILAALAIDFTLIASERIGIPLAILLCLVNIPLLYSLRDSLWRYDLRARVGRGFRPPLFVLAITAFGLALIFGLIIVMMLEVRGVMPEVEPTEGLLRVVTTIMLALTFVNVTLSAMIMAADIYSNWLNHEMPQPIYAQERRLLWVIEAELRAMTQRTIREAETMKANIFNLERTPDAGVRLTLSTEAQVKPEPEQESLRQRQNWRIEADRWGRIIKMDTAGAPQYIAVEKLPANDNTKATEDKGGDNGQPEPTVSGEVIL